jgi:hypothetical protein
MNARWRMVVLLSLVGTAGPVIAQPAEAPEGRKMQMTVWNGLDLTWGRKGDRFAY